MKHANATAQAGDNRLSADNAALLMVDHQTGLMQLVRDYSADEFKNNVLAIADIGKLYNLPTILTTSFETGPNGPLLPEIKAIHKDAPYIARPGEINAWDNPDFLKAVKSTGRKKLIIAGIVTDVCVAFPALDALAAGYDVYVCADASGTSSHSVRDAALLRMVHAGAIISNWFAIACELQRDWRKNGEGLADLLGKHFVSYANLISSHNSK